MFERPTFKQIIDRTEADFKAALSLSSVLRRSVISALARVVAATGHNIHSQIEYLSRQLFPDQADAQNLERHASIYGISRKEAVFSQLTVDVVFTAVATLPAGTVFKRSDNVEFIVVDEVTSAGAETLLVTLEGGEPGALFNTADGDTLTLESPISGVTNEALVSATVIEGTDTEDDESLRARLLSRIQTPPSGGTIDDYKQFAFEVADIGRVWVIPDLSGPFIVGVTAVTTNGDAMSVAKTAEVQANIEAKKPVTAKTIVFSPVEQLVDIEIALTPNTSVVQAEVTAELTDLFTRETEVRGAYAGVATPSFTGRVALSKISEAISVAAGENDHDLTSPIISPEPNETGSILKLGTVTFTTLVV